MLLRSEQPLPLLRDLSEWALERGYPLQDIDVRRPTLEEIYLRLTAGGS
jgi:ABC-2 type transport system ATP-binding protein